MRAVLTLHDDMRWSSECPDADANLEFQIDIDLRRIGAEPFSMRFSADCRDMPGLLNHQIETGLAERGYGTLVHIPDYWHAEAKRVARILGGEIIEFKFEHPETRCTEGVSLETLGEWISRGWKF